MLHKRLSLEMEVIKNYENTLVHIKLYYLKVLHIVSKVKNNYFAEKCPPSVLYLVYN